MIGFRCYVDVNYHVFASFLKNGRVCLKVEYGIDNNFEFNSAQDLGYVIRLWFIPPDYVHLIQDTQFTPRISFTTMDENVRKANAVVSDYLSHDFPVSPVEMCAEFTEMAEEVLAILNPLVEEKDNE